MAVELYTHRFKFSVGDGGKFIKGFIEFNTDGKVSFKMTSWSEPILKETLDHFSELTELIKKIFYAYGDIQEIKFTKMGVDKKLDIELEKDYLKVKKL